MPPNTRTPLQKMDAQRRYAWCQYYEVVNNHHSQDYNHYTTLHKIVVEESISEHLKKQILDMAQELKKVWECPVCLEFIATDNLEITPCGHFFCKPCLTTIKEREDPECAMCRKKFQKPHSH